MYFMVGKNGVGDTADWVVEWFSQEALAELRLMFDILDSDSFMRLNLHGTEAVKARCAARLASYLRRGDGYEEMRGVFLPWLYGVRWDAVRLFNYWERFGFGVLAFVSGDGTYALSVGDGWHRFRYLHGFHPAAQYPMAGGAWLGRRYSVAGLDDVPYMVDRSHTVFWEPVEDKIVRRVKE